MQCALQSSNDAMHVCIILIILLFITSMAQQEDVFKKIVSHAKEYGFVFQSSEIYDGLSAVYDYGQNGVELKNNIKRYWWDAMTLLHENIVGIDSAIFMHPTIWKASGHVDAFNDPLIDNRDSKKRYRADVLIEEEIAKIDDKIEKEVAKARKRFGESFDEALYRETNPRVVEYKAKRDALHERFSQAMNDNDLAGLRQIIIDQEIVCPISGTKNWTEVRQFNLMFKTEMGSTAEGAMNACVFRSVSHRLARRSVTKSWPVSLFSVCVSLSRWRCSSLSVQERNSNGFRHGKRSGCVGIRRLALVMKSIVITIMRSWHTMQMPQRI